MSRSRIASATAAFALVISACASSPVAPECRRFDVANLNPDNDFKARVDLGEKFLNSAGDRIDVSFSVIRLVEKEVTLVQVIGGNEVARWNLRIGIDAGLKARCIIGLPGEYSDCEANVSDPPHPASGYYYLQANGNRVLEAGLAFRLCR